MKSNTSMFFILLLFASSLYSSESCTKDDRMYGYFVLNKDVEILLDSLPIFTQKEEALFQKIRMSSISEKHGKYKKTTKSNPYIIYSNRLALENLHVNVQGIIQSNEDEDIYTELELLFKISNNVLYNTQFFGSYLDSAYMYKRKLVSKKYSQIAKDISWHTQSINRCAPFIIRTIQNMN